MRNEKNPEQEAFDLLMSLSKPELIELSRNQLPVRNLHRLTTKSMIANALIQIYSVKQVRKALAPPLMPRLKAFLARHKILTVIVAISIFCGVSGWNYRNTIHPWFFETQEEEQARMLKLVYEKIVDENGHEFQKKYPLGYVLVYLDGVRGANFPKPILPEGITLDIDWSTLHILNITENRIDLRLPTMTWIQGANSHHAEGLMTSIAREVGALTFAVGYKPDIDIILETVFDRSDGAICVVGFSPYLGENPQERFKELHGI